MIIINNNDNVDAAVMNISTQLLSYRLQLSNNINKDAINKEIVTIKIIIKNK